MKEHNYTIPLQEALEKRTPCFLCTIESELTERALDYYLGAAVMEPSVRIETNQKGFCRHHAEKMLQMGQRLPLMLSFQTRLETVTVQLRKQTKPPHAHAEHCAVCDRVHRQMDNCMDNCLWLFKTEPSFLEKYLDTPGMCVHHFQMLAMRMRRKNAALYKTLHTHLLQQLEILAADIDAFTRSFDYRNTASESMETVPRRSVIKLTGGKE